MIAQCTGFTTRFKEGLQSRFAQPISGIWLRNQCAYRRLATVCANAGLSLRGMDSANGVPGLRPLGFPCPKPGRAGKGLRRTRGQATELCSLGRA